MTWFDPQYDYISEFIDNWNSKLRRFKGMLIVVAVLLLVVGVLCALLPEETFLTIQIFPAAGAGFCWQCPAGAVPARRCPGAVPL